MKGLSDKGLLRVARLMRLSDKIPGGKGDGKKPSDFDPKQMEKGLKVEMEHTDDPEVAEEIEMDHLTEFDGYYDELEEMEDDLKKKSKYTPPDYPTGTAIERARGIKVAVKTFYEDLYQYGRSYRDEMSYVKDSVLPALFEIIIQMQNGETFDDSAELEEMYQGLQGIMSKVSGDPGMSIRAVENLQPALDMLSEWIGDLADDYSKTALGRPKSYPQGDYPLGVPREDIALQPKASEDQDFLDEEMGEQGIRNALRKRLAKPRRPAIPGGKGKTPGGKPPQDWYSDWERQKEQREDEMLAVPVPSEPELGDDLGIPEETEVLDEDWDVEVDMEKNLIEDEGEAGPGRGQVPDSIGDGSDVWWPYTGDGDEADGEPGK
jgi:hypothetical protein